MASLRVHTEPITVRTGGKGTYEITDQISEVLTRSGIVTGTVTVFVQHTSCSLIIMENADPTARRDLEEFFDRLVPENAPYFEHDSRRPRRHAFAYPDGPDPLERSDSGRGIAHATWERGRGFSCSSTGRRPSTKHFVTVMGE